MHLAEREPVMGDVVSRAWYAIYSRHQHEKAVAQILSNKGLEIFLPLYRVAHRWQDRTCPREQRSLQHPGCLSFGSQDGRIVESPLGLFSTSCNFFAWQGLLPGRAY